ncbi:hypothetical protein [Nocardia sp. NPDC004722]
MFVVHRQRGPVDSEVMSHHDHPLRLRPRWTTPTALPEIAMVWGTASAVTNILNSPKMPSAVEYGYDYIPLPCTVDPERIIE